MDDRNDHVSIDFKKLADSFECKFKNLYPLSKECCIYEVPPKIRMLNESLYTPKMVSIGPLHYGREELKVMEEHKLRYLKKFLERTHVRMEKFLKFIKDREVALRNCYAETIKFGSESFVKIIFLDAVFLIEIFLRSIFRRSIPQFQSVDRVFSNPRKIKDIVLDIMLVENQLPMFILQELFDEAELKLPDKFKNWPLSWFAHDFLKSFVCQGILIDTTSIKNYFSEAKHVLDLLRLCLQPLEDDVNRTQTQTDSENDGTERQDDRETNSENDGIERQDDSETDSENDRIERQDDRETAPNITKLHEFGIMFKPASTNNLLDIKFERGTLEIPKLTISNMTINLLRNLHMFELLHGDTNFINDYHILLHRLLSTSQDVELLIQAEVIENRVSDSEGVSRLFRELSRDARVDIKHFYYSGLVKDLQDYSRSKRHKWKAILRQKYCSNPWVSVSVGAASMILILTIIQTVCSIIGLTQKG